MASSPARVVGNQAPLALPADLPVHLSTTLSAELGGADAAATSSLAVALAAVPDARCRRGLRHELTGVLTIAACACLTGATSYVAISEWAAAQGAAVLDCLGDQHSAGAVLPCEATLRRCLQTTDSAALDAAVAGWAGRQLAVQQALAAGGERSELVWASADRRVIAIDGKTLRGSAPRSTPEQVAAARRGAGRSHLVAAYDQASGVTLGQLACAPEAGKGGEVATAGTLIAALDSRGLLAESVITVDAGFTARELAADLHHRGAYWILRIRGNQKTLHTRLKALPWKDVPEAGRVRSVGHGRVETRTIRVIGLAGSSDGHGEFFPAASQALKIVRRRRGRHGRWSVQTVYAVTSLDARQADPALLACWVRGHWTIEAGLHWVRDVTFAEDHSQIRTAHGSVNLAALRTLAINALRLAGYPNIAAGLRQHARTPLLPLATLGLA
jgi:Transposase DDE domain/DDE_Tnp_1-associated